MRITTEEFRKDPSKYLNDLSETIEIVSPKGEALLTIGGPVSLDGSEFGWEVRLFENPEEDWIKMGSAFASAEEAAEAFAEELFNEEDQDLTENWGVSLEVRKSLTKAQKFIVTAEEVIRFRFKAKAINDS